MDKMRVKRNRIIVISVLVAIIVAVLVWMFIDYQSFLGSKHEPNTSEANVTSESGDDKKPEGLSSDGSSSGEMTKDDASALLKRAEDKAKYVTDAQNDFMMFYNECYGKNLSDKKDVYAFKLKMSDADRERLYAMDDDFLETLAEDSKNKNIWYNGLYSVDGHATWSLGTCYEFTDKKVPLVWTCKADDDTLMAYAIGEYDDETGKIYVSKTKVISSAKKFVPIEDESTGLSMVYMTEMSLYQQNTNEIMDAMDKLHVDRPDREWTKEELDAAADAAYGRDQLRNELRGDDSDEE